MATPDPHPAPQPVLSVRDLSVAFRVDGIWRPAVESLTFDVGPRQTVAVVGESGSGKSVTIAMALACRPKLLIADEPTTALDVTVQAQILELIKLLQDEEGMSVVFITHDMGVVAEIADRVVVMWKGRKVEEGEAANVLEHPEHPYTRALLAAVPRLGSMKGEAQPKPFPEPEVDTERRDEADAPSPSAPRASAAAAQPGRPLPVNGQTQQPSQRPILEVANLVT